MVIQENHNRLYISLSKNQCFYRYHLQNRKIIDCLELDRDYQVWLLSSSTSNDDEVHKT